MGNFMSFVEEFWLPARAAEWVWHEMAPVFAQDRTPAPPLSMNLWGGDFWGYIPPNAKTTQTIWGQQNRPGLGLASMIGPRVQDGPEIQGYTSGINVPGLPNDMLQSMIGYPVANSMLPDVSAWNETTSLQFNTFAKITKPSDNKFLQDTTQCTPFNFPNCSMMPMKNSSAKVYLPSTLNVNNPPNCWNDNTVGDCVVQGNETDLFAEYMASLDDLWVHYSTNGTEYLKDVNEHDTSSWDPCRDADKQVDNVLQMTFGVLFAIGLRVVQAIFVPESAELIDMPGNVALTVGPVAAGWFFAKHSLNTDKAAAKVDLSHCATCLLYTVSFTGAGFAGKITNDPAVAIALGAAGGYLLDSVLNDTIVVFFSSGTIVPTYLLKFLGWLLRKIVKGKCVLDYADNLMCLSPENADSDVQFKQVHTRRWDVASIAALLTDEALDDMQITHPHRRASKQAEFVWKGLMYGVGIMTIGSSSGLNSVTGLESFGVSYNVFENGSANPLGEITPIVYGGSVSGSAWDNFWDGKNAFAPWGQVYQPMGLGSWEGASVNQAGTHFDWLINWLKGDPSLTAACNLYGCNNWDVIRKNTYGAHQSPSTAHISEMMTNYKQALIAHYSDANYELMLQIAGTPTGDGWKRLAAPDDTFQGLTWKPTDTIQQGPLKKIVGVNYDPVADGIQGFFGQWQYNSSYGVQVQFAMDVAKVTPMWRDPASATQRCQAHAKAGGTGACVVSQKTRDYVDALSYSHVAGNLSPVAFANVVTSSNSEHTLSDVTLSHYIHAIALGTPMAATRNAWVNEWLYNEPDQPRLKHLLSLSQPLF